ncbi:MAG: ABC transporter permease [Eubacteriales bacterium]|nr:ABC transporter permease [Eubacteriales bacterium]
MLNTLRMDIKRTFNSRSLYVVLIINFCLLIILSLLFSFIFSDLFQEMTIGNNNISVHTQNQAGQIHLSEEQVEMLRKATNEEMSVGYLMYGMRGAGLYSLLIFIGLFVVSELDTGFIKNIPLSSKRRTQLVLSKLVVAIVVSLSQVFVYILAAIIGNLINTGQVNFGSLNELASYWGPYCLITSAYASLIIFCGYLSKSKVLTIILASLLSMGIVDLFLRMLARIMDLPSESFVKYSLMYFYQQDSFSIESLKLTLPIALGFCLAFSGLSIYRARTMEIK